MSEDAPENDDDGLLQAFREKQERRRQKKAELEHSLLQKREALQDTVKKVDAAAELLEQQEVRGARAATATAATAASAVAVVRACVRRALVRPVAAC